MARRAQRVRVIRWSEALSLVLVSVLTSAGCVPASSKGPATATETSNTPAPKAETPRDNTSGTEKPYSPHVLAARHSLGPLALGLTEEEVVRVVGQPAKRSGAIDEAATGLTISVWSYPELGLELLLSRSEADAPALLERMTAAAPCEFVTNRGIGVGATRAEVDSAYALDYSQEEPPDAERVVVDSIYDGLILSFVEGKVTSLFFGAAAE